MVLFIYFLLFLYLDLEPSCATVIRYSGYHNNRLPNTNFTTALKRSHYLKKLSQQTYVKELKILKCPVI